MIYMGRKGGISCAKNMYGSVVGSFIEMYDFATLEMIYLIHESGQQIAVSKLTRG